MEILKHKVAVYGSLLSGLGNYPLIGRYVKSGGAKLLGETTTEELFDMYDLGYFPGLKDNGNSHIHIEVYAVCEEALASIRRLEGYRSSGDGMYAEKMINTEFGEAAIYIYNSKGRSLIEPNTDNIINWRNHLENRKSLNYAF